MKEELFGDGLGTEDLVKFLLDRINRGDGMVSQHAAQLALLFIEKRQLKAKSFGLKKENFQALLKALKKRGNAGTQISSVVLNIEKLKNEIKDAEEKIVRLEADAEINRTEAGAEIKKIFKKNKIIMELG